MNEPSDLERIKRDSRHLRGTLRESLADPVTGALRADDVQLLKFHGGYQQDDRDVREARRLAKLEPDYSFFLRLRLPGGVLTPAQWLAMDAAASRYGTRGLRLTTRQTIQVHGIEKRNLRAAAQAIHASGLDTIAACGDDNRNVAAAVNPLLSRLHAQVFAQASALSSHLRPKSRAWFETWLDEPATDGNEAEPLLGDTYLPRKFKIGFAVPPENDIDVYSQDVGLVAIVEDGKLAGYDVLVGGGMGASHGDARTYPRLASPIGFITPDQATPLAEAALTTQRDHGDRGERKHARFKYTVDDKGLDWIKAEIERRAGFVLQPARGFVFTQRGDRFGWREGEDGRWHLGLRIPFGRVHDKDGVARQTGMRAIASLLAEQAPAAQIRLTPNQNAFIAGVAANLRERIDAVACEHDLALHRTETRLGLDAVACVALPTCGLAMAEAERWMPDFLPKVQGLLDAHGLHDEPIDLRVSGCPNGCSRPYLAEIALIGKAPGRYNLMLGGDHRGQRLNALHRGNIVESEILAELDTLFTRFAAGRETGERFGDFLARAGVATPPLPHEATA
ncbi:MAG: NADPH-dependent assimilatory sulfite reductase hemoprotein subunit [Xanthomonadales bacterium]|nr:NADPH-dependent assimilatory sulfite reductase hemoprotein subunit [Xanthomonadales bacterium]ODU92638.1 MAG: sulfite reductase subunit beta [Rhodanobacter sp. SCN 66-43]OJY85419.1 MAG: sulfite reductase subunit beta [Xanthomonadales bacterium 66-474]